MDLFRYRCYLASLQGGELPNPKRLLAFASRPTKVAMGRLGIFSVSSFHALVSAGAGLGLQGSLLTLGVLPRPWQEPPLSYPCRFGFPPQAGSPVTRAGSPQVPTSLGLMHTSYEIIWNCFETLSMCWLRPSQAYLTSFHIDETTDQSFQSLVINT